MPMPEVWRQPRRPLPDCGKPLYCSAEQAITRGHGGLLLSLSEATWVLFRCNTLMEICPALERRRRAGAKLRQRGGLA